MDPGEVLLAVELGEVLLGALALLEVPEDVEPLGVAVPGLQPVVGAEARRAEARRLRDSGRVTNRSSSTARSLAQLWDRQGWKPVKIEAMEGTVQLDGETARPAQSASLATHPEPA